MKLFSAMLLSVLTLAACAGKPVTPEERAGALSSAALKMIRAEHMVMAGRQQATPALVAADSAFNRAARQDPKCVKQWIESGGGACAPAMDAFLETAGALDNFAAPDDPASVVRTVLSEADESSASVGPLFDGYAAAFQLCLEMERDGTLMQDFLPFLVAVGCPLTLRDFGLDEVKAGRLRQLSTDAAGRTAEMPYPTGQEHFFITFIKINNWASRFSNQVNGDSMAAQLLATEGSGRVFGHIRKKSAMRIGFLGDSQMDPRHWSTPAPFPDIVGAVLKRLNPGMEVINAGVGGDDSGEALERMDEDLIAHKPDITFVLLGGNDAQHWGKPNPAVTPGQFRINMTGIVGRIRAAGGRAVLVTYPLGPTEEGADLEVFQAIRGQLDSLADSLGTSHLDIAKILDAEQPELVYAVDMIHFNPTTHLKIAGMVLARLAAMESPDELKK